MTCPAHISGKYRRNYTKASFIFIFSLKRCDHSYGEGNVIRKLLIFSKNSADFDLYINHDIKNTKH